MSRRKTTLKAKQEDSKRPDTLFPGRLPCESLPRREHPQRKRRKTEKAKELGSTDDELSEASFTLLTDNESEGQFVQNEADAAVTEESEFSDINDSSDRGADDTSFETAPTSFGSPINVNNINHLLVAVDTNKEKVSSRTIATSTMPTSNFALQADECIAVEDYTLSVYVYRCLKRPNRIVFDLSQWEARHGICTLVSDEDETDMHVVPEDATYLIFGDYMIGELGGSAIFFAARINENRVDEKYILKVGFYFEYRDCLKAWVDDICSSNCDVPLVELAEIISPIHGPRFRALYSDMEWAVNLEYWSRCQRPRLKKYIHIANSVGSRRRSRVITSLDLVFEEADSAESETNSNGTNLGVR